MAQDAGIYKRNFVRMLTHGGSETEKRPQKVRRRWMLIENQILRDRDLRS